MKKILLGIDQGTSGLKITAFDLDGQVVASSHQGYETFYPKPLYVEQNCEDWWSACIKGIKDILKVVDRKAIAGIGVDGISWACIPVDKKGDVLYPTMIWLDRRATEEVQWMKSVIGEKELIALSGNPVDPAYITPKILWLKNNEPDIYKKTDKFLQSNAYLVYKMTGKMTTDYSQGYGLHFFDITTGTFNKTVSDKLGISLDLIPPLCQSHDIAGGITKEVSELTGLVEGTPVVAGGLDAACCTLGAGVIDVGQTQEQGGQAGGMSIVTSEPLIHEKLILGRHVIPNKWLLQGGTTGGGGTLRWFRKTIEDDAVSFEDISTLAEASSACSNGVVFLPYMKGERSPLWNSKAQGMFYGINFDTEKKDMVRSIMEGVAFSLKHNLDEADSVNAVVDKLISVGGSANSEIWTQIKSNITGKTIQVPYADHATSLGAAILAGVGCGLYDSFETAVSKTIRIKKTYMPDQDIHKKYQLTYETYLKLSHVMVDHMWK